MRKLVIYLLFFSGFAKAAFFEDVVKGVTINVLSDVIKEEILNNKKIPIIDETNTDDAQISIIVNKIIDEDVSIYEKIALYSDKVDYFGYKSVDQEFIINKTKKYQKHWPTRFYNLVSIDKISMSEDHRMCAVLYTANYELSNQSKSVSGTTHVAMLIGNPNENPKIYSIKEWLE